MSVTFDSTKKKNNGPNTDSVKNVCFNAQRNLITNTKIKIKNRALA